MRGNTPNMYDVAVIGGGPAGLAAATVAAGHSLSTVLIDEQATPGGQIYRGIAETPALDRSILGPDYARGAPLVEAFTASGAHHLAGTTVWTVEPGFRIGTSANGKAAFIGARHVILATGAMERPFPIPGWTLPGVLGAGAAQILLKSSGLVPEGPLVLAGTGPLLWLLAWQYHRAGVPVRALLDTTPTGGLWRARHHMGDFLRSPYLVKGVKLLLSVRHRIPVITGVAGLRAEGRERLEAVLYRTTDGREQRLDAQILLLHQGVIPNPNLANAIGCAQEWDEGQLCWKAKSDRWGMTSIEGVSVAGDGAGIGGALVAEQRGRIAALDAAFRLGRLSREARDAAAVPVWAALKKAGRGRAFLDRFYRPADALRIPQGETMVCRCEEVTAKSIVEAVGHGCTGPNQAKAFLRCGMGPCQGRFCGTTVTELIAHHRQVSPSDVGYFRLRPPVKPITLAELATLPRTQADIDAVHQ